MSEDRNKHDRSGGKAEGGYPVGNKDPNRRGRGPKGAIGQDIPKDVKRKASGGKG